MEKMTRGKTNKQLLKAGLSHFEIIELIQGYMQQLAGEALEIRDISEITEADGVWLSVTDYSKRVHTFSIQLDAEGEGLEDVITYYTQTAQDREDAYYGRLDEPFRNKKQLASIKAAYNNFLKVLGL